nr:hypothetical protein [Escherichia coli]
MSYNTSQRHTTKEAETHYDGIPSVSATHIVSEFDGSICIASENSNEHVKRVSALHYA